MPTASAASTSSGSFSPATAFREFDQIVEDDSRKSPMREVHLPSDFSTLFPPTGDGRDPAPDHAFLDNQLISPTSRLSRLPLKVPSSPQTNTTSLAPVAISGYQNSNTSNTSQDVHHLVNSSTSLPSSLVTRAGLASPETTVSSFTQPLTQHVINHPIRRPRTIIQSRADLAAQYGIPSIFPPAPSTAPRTSSVTPVKTSAPVSPDFSALRNNYLTMLNNNPTDTSTSVTAHTAPIMSTTATLGFNASDITQEIEDYINMSPDFREQTLYDWHTPVVPELDTFDPSPMETPMTDFLTTPILSLYDEPLVSGANITNAGANLFHHSDVDTWYGMEGYGLDNQPASSAKIALDSIDVNHLYSISPYSPPLDSFDSFSPTVTVVPPASVPTVQAVNAPTTSTPAVVADAPTASRRAKATGIRKGITPEGLLDVDAPTQPRKYATPSSTSRKEVPAVFARKRTRSDAFGEEEEDELDSLPPDDTERHLIEAKRRQNTVAARRSRRRKLEQVQSLERAAKVEQKLKEIYKERAEVVIGMLKAHGIPVPDFPSEEETLASLGEF